MALWLRRVAGLTAALLIWSSCRRAEDSQRAAVLSNKKYCFELARTRLEKDDAAAHPGGFVDAEWCFSQRLNTCIYSSDEVIIGRPPVEGVELPKTVHFRKTIDLLTNHALIIANALKEPADREYELQRRTLFDGCTK